MGSESAGRGFANNTKTPPAPAGTRDEEVLWGKVFPSRKFPLRFVLQLFMGTISSAELSQAKKAFSSALSESQKMLRELKIRILSPSAAPILSLLQILASSLFSFARGILHDLNLDLAVNQNLGLAKYSLSGM